MKLSVAFVSLVALFGCSIVHAEPQARIAGGEDAVLGQLPYQAVLDVSSSYNCGVVILAERYALTALTCVCSAGSSKPWPPQMFTVTVGTVDLYNDGQRIRVEEITINPQFKELSTGVALLRLGKLLVFNNYIRSISLASENPPLYADIEVSGWGKSKETDANMQRFLQIGHSFVEAPRACRKANDTIVNDQILCLGHHRRQGICRGDIGGPAVYLGTLVGLGAELLGECGSMLPERFISIAVYRKWILNQINK